jgi:hypothetical protein
VSGARNLEVDAWHCRGSCPGPVHTDADAAGITKVALQEGWCVFMHKKQFVCSNYLKIQIKYRCLYCIYYSVMIQIKIKKDFAEKEKKETTLKLFSLGGTRVGKRKLNQSCGRFTLRMRWSKRLTPCASLSKKRCSLRVPSASRA